MFDSNIKLIGFLGGGRRGMRGIVEENGGDGRERLVCGR